MGNSNRYEECLVRYSDENFFGVAEVNGRILLYNIGNISDPNRLADFFSINMTDMAEQAANNDSGKKFVTREVGYGPFETIYSMVQCTPDLPATECERCLFNDIEYYPRNKRGGSMLIPSCRLRFDLYPFYDVIASPPPPASPPPHHLRAYLLHHQQLCLRPKVTIVAVSSVGVLELLLAMAFCVVLIRQQRKKPEAADDEIVSDEFSAADSLQYDFRVLQAATNNFSDRNKLGEGGFGGVYKGILPSGREVAVKRLSRGSSQGITEFKNEVVLVHKLQHRNLVRLLGFCLAGDEKLLVYEFVPNKSLDCLLFDHEDQARLDWPRRFKIIEGIARGMLYLHEESRLRIIHRDLKPTNILLDSEDRKLPLLRLCHGSLRLRTEEMEGGGTIGVHGSRLEELILELRSDKMHSHRLVVTSKVRRSETFHVFHSPHAQQRIRLPPRSSLPCFLCHVDEIDHKDVG